MLTSTATISYTIAAAAYLFLAALLLTRWRSRSRPIVLPVACLISALWGSALAYQATKEPSFSLGTDILEILRNAGWSMFLVLLLGVYRQGSSPAISRISPAALALAMLYICCLILVVYVHTNLGFSSAAADLDFLKNFGSLAMAITGMILVEQLYRNTPTKQRWGIKFACLGIGGIFAYDFYLYSEALLLRHINSDIWAARGIINALVVPLIAVSAARKPQWSIEITVSRRILFYSAALFGAAVYLLTMAAAGYYFRFFGGSWGTVMQVTFLFGAVILLLAVLFTGTLRSWLRVFISKHFFSYNYDYREEWLRFTRTLSEGGQGLEERVLQALAQLVESPGAALWVCHETGKCEPVSHWNINATSGAEP